MSLHAPHAAAPRPPSGIMSGSGPGSTHASTTLVGPQSALYASQPFICGQFTRRLKGGGRCQVQVAGCEQV